MLRYSNWKTKDIFYIPETKDEWDDLKQILIEKYKLEDDPSTWTFILSQLQGVKMPELKTSFSSLVAHYKRWKISGLLQDEKTVYIRALNDKLELKVKEQMEALAKEVSEDAGPPSPDQSEQPTDVPIGAHDSERVVQELPEAQEGVVRAPSW